MPVALREQLNGVDCLVDGPRRVAEPLRQTVSSRTEPEIPLAPDHHQRRRTEVDGCRDQPLPAGDPRQRLEPRAEQRLAHGGTDPVGARPKPLTENGRANARNTATG